MVGVARGRLERAVGHAEHDLRPAGSHHPRRAHEIVRRRRVAVEELARERLALGVRVEDGEPPDRVAVGLVGADAAARVRGRGAERVPGAVLARRLSGASPPRPW